MNAEKLEALCNAQTSPLDKNISGLWLSQVAVIDQTMPLEHRRVTAAGVGVSPSLAAKRCTWELLERYHAGAADTAKRCISIDVGSFMQEATLSELPKARYFCRGKCLVNSTDVRRPAAEVVLDAHLYYEMDGYEDATGLAAHVNQENAQLHGFLESLERFCITAAWRCKNWPITERPLSIMPAHWTSKVKNAAVDVRLFDCRVCVDMPPVIIAVVIDHATKGVALGSAARMSGEAAAESALQEALMIRSTVAHLRNEDTDPSALVSPSKIRLTYWVDRADEVLSRLDGRTQLEGDARDVKSPTSPVSLYRLTQQTLGVGAIEWYELYSDPSRVVGRLRFEHNLDMTTSPIRAADILSRVKSVETLNVDELRPGPFG